MRRVYRLLESLGDGIKILTSCAALSPLVITRITTTMTTADVCCVCQTHGLGPFQVHSSIYADRWHPPTLIRIKFTLVPFAILVKKQQGLFTTNFIL